MSAFDDIDRQFRKPKKPEIILEPRVEGDCCPDPKCGGSLTYKPDGACPCPACGWAKLTCNRCGWIEGAQE